MFLRSHSAPADASPVSGSPGLFRGAVSTLLTTLFLASGAPARADIILSSAAFSGTDSSGVGPIGYGTTTAVAGYTLFMANGAFSDSPDYINTVRATPDLDEILPVGTDVLSGYMSYGGLSYGATSLFFGGSTTAGISVFASQTDNASSVPTFAADANTLASVTGTTRERCWLIERDNGTETVTLTNYILASTTLINNQGGPWSARTPTSGGPPTIGFPR